MNKNEIKEMIKNLQEVGLLTQEESDTYLEAIESSEEFSLDLIENVITEVALERGTIQDDIEKLARMLKLTTKSKQATEKGLFTLIEKPNILNITSVEVYEIQNYDFSINRFPVKYHFIIGVDYNDNNYTFGYNENNGGLSYTINDGQVSWFNLPKDFRDEPIPHIKDLLVDIMDIDMFE